jgi:hypothetical protein
MAFARTVATTHTKTLISPSTGSADKVYGVDYVSASSHTSTGAVSGATVGGIPYCPTATSEAMSGMTWNANGTAGEGLAITAGTATTDISPFSWSQTRNNAGVVFNGAQLVVTDTAVATGSSALQVKAGATVVFGISTKDGLGVTGIYAPALGLGTSASLMNFRLAAGSETYYDASYAQVNAVFGRSGNDAEWRVGQLGRYNWSNSNTGDTAADTGLSKISAGLLAIGTGAQASFAGRLKLTSVIHAGVTVANLNAAPTTGEVQSVTDALAPVAGAAVAAGGAAKALVWWNGAAWNVIGV